MRLQSLLNLVPFYLLLTSLPQTFSQATSTTVLDSKTDAFINGILKDWNSPGGVAVAVVRMNEQGEWVNVETKGYGRATASGTPVTANTTFNIGSNSKLFTVLATSLLINNETLSPRLDWNSKIKTFIPEFNLTDPIAARETTLLDMMTHRTGYPLHDFSYTYQDDAPAVIKKIQYLRQSAEFRDIWQYNNVMYITLSHLPKVLVGKPFARYVKENIFDRFGMTGTTYSYELANSNGQRADGMTRQGQDVYADPFSGVPAATEYWTSKTGGEDGSVLAGAGGVITNAVDMATLLQTLLLDGKNPRTNETVIPPGVLQKITTALSIQAGQPEFPEHSSIIYGAGQLQIVYRGHLIYEHGGFIRGFNTQISRLPDSNLGISVLTNDNEYGKVMTEIVKNHIIDKVLGLEPIDWSARYKAQKSVPPARATVRSANAALASMDFPSIAGTYNNDGYGSFELCQITPENSAATSSCKALASNVSTILPGAIRPGIPTFLARLDRPWFSHIKLEHFNQDLFNVSLLISTPQNNTAAPYWTFNDKSASDNAIIAELDVQGSRVGLGMAGFWAGLWDGAVAGVPKPLGNTVRERAEVYWDKV